MQARRDKFGNKRKIRPREMLAEVDRAVLSRKVNYCGNPAHKKNPGDFGLTPPSGPRAGKSLCDVAAIFEKDVASSLLKEGVMRGLVSMQFDGEWPKVIWSVTADEIVLEARLENRETGAYHGYPMQSTDPFAELILTQWRER